MIEDGDTPRLQASVNPAGETSVMRVDDAFPRGNGADHPEQGGRPPPKDLASP